MPTVSFQKPQRSPQGLDRVTSQGGGQVGAAISQVGGQVMKFAEEQADKLIEKKAKIENAKASRAAIELQNGVLSRRNEFRDEAIADGLDPETDEGRAAIESMMREEYLIGVGGIVGGIETNRGKDRYRVTAEKLGANFDIDVASVGKAIQRDAALTNASIEVEAFSNGVRANVASPRTAMDSLETAIAGARESWEARGVHLSASEKKQAVDLAEAQVRGAYVASVKEHAFADPQEAKDFIRNPFVRQRMVELGFKGGEVDALEQELIRFSQERNFETTIRRMKDGDLDPFNSDLTLDEIAGNHSDFVERLRRMEGDDLSIFQVQHVEQMLVERQRTLVGMVAAQRSLDEGRPISANNAEGFDALSARVMGDPSLSPEAKDQWIVSSSTTAGFMPQAVAREVSAGFRGDIPEMARSKRLIDRMLVTNPAIIRSGIDSDHTLDADAQMVYQKMSDADFLGEQEAAALAQELLRGKAQDGAEVSRRRQEFNVAVAGLPAGATERDFALMNPDADTPLADGFRGHMDDTFDIGGMGLGIFVEPDARNDMFQHYTQVYRELASVYGFDDGSVSRKAWDMTLAAYGQSEFGVPKGPLAFDGEVARVLGIEPGRAIDQGVFEGITGAGPVDNILARLEPYTHEAPLVRKPLEKEFEKAGLNPQNGRRDLYLEIKDALPEQLRGKLEIEETWFQSGVGDRNIKFDGRRVYARYDEAASDEAGRPTYKILVDGLGAIGQPLPISNPYYQPPQDVRESLVWQRHGKEPDFYSFGERAAQQVFETLDLPDIRTVREALDENRRRFNRERPDLRPVDRFPSPTDRPVNRPDGGR